jgi:hypothetical protein
LGKKTVEVPNSKQKLLEKRPLKGPKNKLGFVGKTALKGLYYNLKLLENRLLKGP